MSDQEQPPGLLGHALDRTGHVEQREFQSLQAERDFWKKEAASNETIIGFLIALAFRRPDYQVAKFDGPGHPEDPRVVLVRSRHDPNNWRQAEIGFDSDIAQLADKIHAWLLQEEAGWQDRVAAVSSELVASEEDPNG